MKTFFRERMVLMPFRSGVSVLAVALFAVWMALSGSLSPAFLLVGLLVAFLIARVSWRPFFGRHIRFSPKNFLRRTVAFVSFVPFFLFAMVKASWDVALQAFRPELSISPGTFVYTPSPAFKGSIVALANAVTLTPGTLTVDILHGRRSLLIHALMAEEGEEPLRSEVRRLEEGIARFTE
ncbi:MAG: Na+/H+ antiporter subunit E [Synergistaceae bacterium]|nr:Na+/H+ antiporter subunit E [Synergistaceae bacterium]